MKFNIETLDRVVIGTVDANKDGNITITFTDLSDYIKNHENIRGHLYFEIKFNSKLIDTTRKVPISFVTSNGVQKIEVTVKQDRAPNTNEIVVKWGKVNSEEGYINWTIRVNYGKKNIQDMVLNEELGVGQELKKGSISIIEAEFDYSTGEAIKEKNVTSEFNISERNNGFNINFGSVNKSYYVRFKSKITDNKLNKYTNTVEVKGTNNIQDKVVVEEVKSTGGAGAEGEVSLKGSVVLTKVDSNNRKHSLEGAEFKLLDATNKEVQTGLKTDTTGRIRVDNLVPVKYKFIETKASVGYVLDSKEIALEIVKEKREVLEIVVGNDRNPYVNMPGKHNVSHGHKSEINPSTVIQAM